MIAQVCKMPLDPKAAEFAEICVKFGVPLGRANIIGNEIARAIEKPYKFDCDHCGKPERSNRSWQKYCTDSCRVLACRARAEAEAG